MRVFPPKEIFLRQVKPFSIPPLYMEIPFKEPYLLYQKIKSPESILFESVKGTKKIASYSFIGFEPYITLKAKDGTTEVISSGRRTLSNKHPFRKLREILSSYRQCPIPGLPPFQGGAAGLFCYDFVRYIERVPCSSKDDLNLPYAHLFFFDKVIAFDHIDGRAWIIVCPGLRDIGLGYRELSDIDWAQKYEESLEEIERIHSLLDRTVFIEEPSPQKEIEITIEMPKEQYIEMVRRAKEYIAAGDIFQANLSLRVSAPIGEISPWNIYKILREVNPSPFACFMDFGGYQIVSSSPERLLMLRDGIIETRPIAGTRPRGGTRAEDDALRAELLLNEKERAEHIMLIDLERNDAGKVCTYGSIKVDEFMTTEDYSHVIHIVSNIRGQIEKKYDAIDAVRAFFPGGTITGVPKVRCMEIIDELEPVRRGPYTGSAGYIGFSGNMDLNIIIRTFLIKESTAYVQAGAGIVADSMAEREYAESLKKAEALMKTLSLASKTCYNKQNG